MIYIYYKAHIEIYDVFVIDLPLCQAIHTWSDIMVTPTVQQTYMCVYAAQSFRLPLLFFDLTFCQTIPHYFLCDKHDYLAGQKFNLCEGPGTLCEFFALKY